VARRKRTRPQQRDPGVMMVIRGCWSKVTHQSREAAEPARLALARTYGAGYAYQCPACSRWHTTKQRQRNDQGFEVAP
jgi:hypothetical protein